MSNTKLTKLSIKKLIYPKELQYKFVPEYVKFCLNNSCCAIANLIRVVLSGYLPVIHLNFNVEIIQTDECVILPDLLSRVQSIPINQNTPLNARFTLYKKNETQNSIWVYSSDIEGYDKLCNGKFRIMRLDIGKYVKINLTMISGNSFTSPSNSLIQTYTYKILDFKPIKFLDSQEYSVIDTYISRKDYKKSDKRKKNLYYNDKKCEEMLKYYKRGAESSAINKLDESFDEFIYIKDLQLYLSTMAYPEEFKLSFVTYGTIDGGHILEKAIKYIISEYTDNFALVYIDNYINYKGPVHLAYTLLDRMKMLYPKELITMNQPYHTENNINFYIDTEISDQKKIIQDGIKDLVGIMKNLLKSL